MGKNKKIKKELKFHRSTNYDPQCKIVNILTRDSSTCVMCVQFLEPNNPFTF